jgi:hypothetical protein
VNQGDPAYSHYSGVSEQRFKNSGFKTAFLKMAVSQNSGG